MIKIEDVETGESWLIQIVDGSESGLIDFINDHPDGVATHEH